MRANSFAGQVIAVLSRRTPAFELDPDEPQTFPGRMRALLRPRGRTDSASEAAGADHVSADEESRTQAGDITKPLAGEEVAPKGQVASAEMSSPRRDDEPGGAARQDIVLTSEDLDDLIEGITATFRHQADADQLLRRIGYPSRRAPSFATDHVNAWNEVFGDFEQGLIETPYRRVLAAALRVYRGNPTFRNLADRYLTPVAQPAVPTAEPAPTAQVANTSTQTAPPTCHVIVSADSEDARRLAGELLARLNLEPAEAWSTGTAISFSVNTTDASSVRRQLDRTDLGWTVVPAGQPDYVYGSLFVEGPDRRRFRIIDAPAQQTFANVTEDFLAENYPQSDPSAPLPTVVEHMREGERHSVNPDSMLHDAGVQDGDELRAAWWVIDNEDRIEAVGGEILFRPQRDRPTYRNTIEEVV